MEGDALLRAVEQRFDALREADREAVRVATSALNARMAGFPEEFARKGEVDVAVALLQRLDKEKLPEAMFRTFVDSYRIEQARADEARRELAKNLALQTELFRTQLIEERGLYVSEETYSQRHESLLRQVDAIERWQYKLVGGLVFATFIAPILASIIVYYVTKTP